MTTNEIHDATQTLAKALAPLVPGGTYREPKEGQTQWGRITLATGGALHVAVSWRDDGRAHIWGEWPKTRKGESVPPGSMSPHTTEMYVTASRQPAAIAKDAIRRVLPGYKAAYAECVARRDGMDNLADKTDTNTTMIAQALKTEPGERGNILHISHYKENKKLSTYGDFEVSADTVEIKLRNVPVHVALAICNILTASR